ncbi:MAG: FprA family A-type flavoprotein [Methanoculleaceae archaeon]
MPPREIRPGIYAVGAVDRDRRLFDDLIPLPDGTSYNAYLVRGSEATVLIDTVDPTKTDVLISNLERLDIRTIDYVVVNHAEQDHSGSLPVVLGRYPEATVVTNGKCADLLEALLQVPRERMKIFGDREVLSLGDRTLEFIHAPWVHWPETQLTYCREDRILFTCDLFGSHYATCDLFLPDDVDIRPVARRYYAEIMMPFRSSVARHLERLASYEIDIIAPGHGPIYRHPELILNAYRDWTSGRVENRVLIPYVSMHGTTRVMVEYLTNALVERGISVTPFNLTVTDIGELAMALVDAATVVLGTPTVLSGPHPTMIHAACIANILRPGIRCAAVIGSYGWGGKAAEVLAGMLDRLDVTLLDSVVIRGYPTSEDFSALDDLADRILEKHIEYGLVERR